MENKEGVYAQTINKRCKAFAHNRLLSAEE